MVHGGEMVHQGDGHGGDSAQGMVHRGLLTPATTSNFNKYITGGLSQKIQIHYPKTNDVQPFLLC